MAGAKFIRMISTNAFLPLKLAAKRHLLELYIMSKRTLRSSASALANVTAQSSALVPPSTPKKRRLDGAVSPKKAKVLFKDWEQHLLRRNPIPADLALPESYISKHNPEFIKGLNHVLQKDPSLYPMIVNEPFKQFDSLVQPRSTSQEHFQGLCRTIIGQQVSGAAARSIEAKFKAYFDGNHPTPDQVLSTEGLVLREKCGISLRKAEYIKSIAQKFVDKEVDGNFFATANDEDVIAKLVEMKGIGAWSAKMAMVFGLHRMDIFAHDDLGVARGISRYLETRPQLLKDAKVAVDMSLHSKRSTFDDKKKRDWKVIHDAHVIHIADTFAPYRSVFMLVMWRASATDIDVISTS